MNRFSSIHSTFFVSCAAMVLSAGPAHARVVPLSGPVQGDPAVAAERAVRASQELLGARAAGLRVARVIPVPHGQVVHLEQVHRGLPVLDAGASVLMQKGRMVAATGQLREVPDSLSVGPAGLLSADQARASLLATASPGVTARGATLAVLAAGSASGEARVVWVVDALLREPLSTHRVLVDAVTGALAGSVPTSLDASGNVYSPNPKVASQATKTLLGLTKTTELTGEYADVQSCGAVDNTTLTCERYAKPDSSGDYLFSLDEGKLDDPFAEVQAYYLVDNIHRWMKDAFGFKRQGDQQIKVMVNFYTQSGTGSKKGYQNAFFGDVSGDKVGDLVFGQTSRDFAYDGDVVYHEFAHSAVDETSDLSVSLDSTGFNAAPGALNEGFADLFSCILAGDPVVGDYITTGGLRTLLGSSTCPKDLSGESDYDGQLLSRAVWAVRSKLSSTKVFDEALYTTMASLNKTAGFPDAHQLLVLTLKAQDATLAQAADAEFKTRGLDTCTRIILLAENQPRKSYIYGKSISPSLPGVPASFQYRIDVPKTAKSLVINLTGGWGWGGASIGAYIRKGQTVGYDYVGPLYDLVKPSNTSSHTLTVGDTQNPLTPGESYYVLPLNVGNYETMLTISYNIKGEDPPAPDMQLAPPDLARPDQGPYSQDLGPIYLDSAGVNPLGPDVPDRGCTCALTAPGPGAVELSPMAGLALLLLGLLLRRRSARRSRLS